MNNVIGYLANHKYSYKTDERYDNIIQVFLFHSDLLLQWRIKKKKKVFSTKRSFLYLPVFSTVSFTAFFGSKYPSYQVILMVLSLFNSLFQLYCAHSCGFKDYTYATDSLIYTYAPHLHFKGSSPVPGTGLDS